MGGLLAPELNGAIDILGASERDRVAVFSINISIPSLLSPGQNHPLRLRHKLLSTMMNEFFGIEMRDGCMCAGPYGLKLLGFDADKEAAFWKLLFGQNKDYTSSIEQQDHSRNRTTTSMENDNTNNKFPSIGYLFKKLKVRVETVLQALEWMAKYG
ncbi:hypothetical protein BGZ76_006218 [Entomortierella beljakovae]|nr:hypothetical protein BGZ76_006218 [Entomortierella beljakovae]